MRPCPVCKETERTEVFKMGYKIPDNWPLPHEITWHTCDTCGMIYGDGNFNQAMLDEFYTKYYGYGVSNPDNIERLKQDAEWVFRSGNWDAAKNPFAVDFGGAGDGGKSVYADGLNKYRMGACVCIGPNDVIPENMGIIYASHVLEHIYDLPQTMNRLIDALAPDGLLIVDVPDSTGLLTRWKMPILDFNTKHLNHFTLRTLLELGYQHGLESVFVKPYELEFAPCFHVHFKRLDVARASREHIYNSINEKCDKLKKIKQPVNIWGLGDVVWHLTNVDFAMPDILDYIDNDPAFRGQTYNGKPVQERPTNDAPILILAQGQRKRLIENIRKMGIENEIIEI